jgi:hypothetical protein
MNDVTLASVAGFALLGASIVAMFLVVTNLVTTSGPRSRWP